MITSVMGLTPMDALEYVLYRNGEADHYIQPSVVEDFERFCKAKEFRLGQEWFNNLTREDRDKLTSSMWDPFRFDDWHHILVALAYLIDPNFNQYYDIDMKTFYGFLGVVDVELS